MSDAIDFPEKTLLLGRAEKLPFRLSCTALAHIERHSLVQRAQEQAADALVLCSPDGEELDAWLEALAGLKPALAGVVIAAGATAAQQQRGLELGLQVWLEHMPTATELLHHLRWARWQAERLNTLQGQLDDRKWTEKAKGLLMSARSLDEDGAFRLLRETAMQAHLRIGEVSRSVVRAAQLAEAVNVAGQQRMLSQRLVKLMAQRAAGIEPARAKALQDESAARIAANLARLPALCTDAAELEALGQAWGRLEPLLKGKPGADVLAQADAAAQHLLALSERFTGALESVGAGKPLRLVNLCGRQRMLCQRLAKEALLADLLPGRDATLLAEGMSEFEAGLAELEASPLSSPAIRELLDEVRAEWLRLLRSLRDAHGREAAAGLARSSEVLMGRLDTLTVLYQQSLQTLLG